MQDLFDSIYKLCQVEKSPGLAAIFSSGTADQPKKNPKEVLKVVVQLMIEDIWSNFENYNL